jgi:hypothetical protein
MPTQERCWELFEYDLETSDCLVNRITRNSRAVAGNEAGCINERGYRQVYVDGKKHYEHRLIWFMVTGEWIPEVDHWNGVRSYNRWSNLRDAGRSQNCQNTDYPTGASALRGVYRRSDRPKWRATIFAGGQFHHLGDFDTAEEARAAYLEAAERLHGEFAFHNRPTPIKEAA